MMKTTIYILENYPELLPWGTVLLRSPQNFSEAAGGSEKHCPPGKELRVVL